MLSAAVDMGQGQCPQGTAQVLGAALGDAGRAAEGQRVIRLQGRLRGVHALTLDGHVVDARPVEDLSDFPAGVLVAPVLVVLDVQRGNDLPTDELPDVHLMNAADVRHGRQLPH